MDNERRNCLPVIHTSGTYYEVGFDIGKTFRHIIQDFLTISDALNNELIPAFEAPEGKQIYNESLLQLEENFPQYVNEIRGTADGADVPFHKLLLLHLDQTLLMNFKKSDAPMASTGCSTVCVTTGEQAFLGHTEDALPEALNHCYIVNAHIRENEPQGKWKVQEEEFSAICYAGHLPGFCMGYNHHGLLYSINILTPAKVLTKKTPRHFLARALLSAQSLEKAQAILRDRPIGSSDGFSVNMTFIKQEGDRLFHNVEVAPSTNEDESNLSILTIGPGEHLLHCNKYLRLKVDEAPGSLAVESSCHRHDTFAKFVKPKCCNDVKCLLGDQSDAIFSFFREGGDPDFVKTICTGIFDCVNLTWSIYIKNPAKSEPLVVIPLQLQ
ncbi:beta-alanyl-dopamine/carcinine hydrolase-like isoform X1 [Artemia franciscana]|uniref:Peptidase C45 hydrolase domain-containing protein n=1 Tax=Artemia franciscana TaxID=6661 RepID=A0AA88IT87_ARTSF|nr:hypothetical protein QYM36_000730 [Artemia franciscana]